MFSIGLPDLVVSKFVYAMIAFLGYLTLMRSRGRSGKNILVLLYAVFVGFHILSLVQSQDFVNSFRYVIFQITVLGAILFFISYFSHQPSRIGLVISASFGALWSTFVFLIIQQVLFSLFDIKTGGIWPVPGYPTRFGSFFWDVNHYGIYIVSLLFPVLSLFLSAVSTNKNIRRIVFFFFTMCAGVYALSLTGSRSAMIAGIAGSLFFSFVTLTQRRKKERTRAYSKYLIPISPLLTVFGLFSFLYFFADAIQKVFLYRAVSFFSHLYLVVTGIRVASDHLITGIGTNAFSAYFRTSPYAQTYYYIDAAALNQKLPLHNLWLETLSETGIVSFLVFLAFWVLLIGGLIRLYREKNDLIALGFASGVVAFLTGGLMYSYKSEFFTVYIAIAVAYVSVHLFSRQQHTTLVAAVRAQIVSIFQKTAQVLNAGVIVLTIGILFSPLLTFVSALTPSELLTLTGGSQGLFSAQFDYLVTHFRYLFGNYSYVPRSIPLIFYLGTYVSLVILLRKMRLVGTISFLVAAIIVFGINGFVFVLSLSPLWMLVFLLCSSVLIITAVFNAPLFPKPLMISVSPRVFIYCITLCVFLFSLGQYRTIQSNTNRYSEDTSFLLELAHNRRIFHNAQLVRDENLPEALFHYYCDDIYHVKKAYVITACNSYSDGQQSVTIPGSLRDVYVGSRVYISRYETKLNGIRKVEILERNDSAILISEPLDQ